MTDLNLPPLPHQFVRDERHLAHEARERVLMAEIERLRRLVAHQRKLIIFAQWGEIEKCPRGEAMSDQQQAELYRFLRWEALGGAEGGVMSIWLDDFDWENAARMEAAKKNHGSPWNVAD